MRNTSTIILSTIIFAFLATTAGCGSSNTVAADIVARCDRMLSEGEHFEAKECYDSYAGSITVDADRVRYGALLANSAMMVDNTWGKLKELIPGGGATLSAFGCAQLEDEQVGTSPSFSPKGLPLNLVIKDLFSRGLSQAIDVRDEATALLARDLAYGYEFTLPISIYLADLAPIFPDDGNPLVLEGRFGRLELVHLKAVASALAFVIQMVQAHDLTISNFESLFKEPNFTTVLARERHFLSLRDPAMLKAAGLSLASFAESAAQLQPEVEARFGESNWLIESIDLHVNKTFDPRDVLVYKFLNINLEEAGYATGALGKLDNGWITFPDSWPDRFFNDLTTGATRTVRNLTSPIRPTIALGDLAPTLAIFGFNAGPLVNLMDLDPAAIFAAPDGIRDYLPYYTCQQGRCMPIESGEWNKDRVHFAAPLTSDRPITQDDEALWQQLLEDNGFEEEEVQHVFSFSITLPADGIYYQNGTTGPSNIYRMYRRPTFNGAIHWDVETLVQATGSSAKTAIENGYQMAGDQFLTNAALAWYTHQTKQSSPFAKVSVVSGFKVTQQSASEEFGCHIAKPAKNQTPYWLQRITGTNRNSSAIPAFMIALGLPFLYWIRQRNQADSR